jgi:glycosyltransferase involved in cell wall biosynthesis
VSNVSAYSGAEDALCRTVAAFPRDGVAVDAVVALSGLFSDRLKQAGASVRTIGHDFFEPSAANGLLADALLGELSPAVIHFNGLVGAPFLAVAVRQRVPIVQHLRITNFDGYQEVFALADKIVCVSEYVRDRARAWGVDESKLQVVYDGIDSDHFSPTNESPAESRHVTTVCASRLARRPVPRALRGPTSCRSPRLNKGDGRRS